MSRNHQTRPEVDAATNNRLERQRLLNVEAEGSYRLRMNRADAGSEQRDMPVNREAPVQTGLLKDTVRLLTRLVEAQPVFANVDIG